MKASVAQVREWASEVLQVCELRDVRLLSANAQSPEPVVSGPFVVETQIEVKGNDGQDGNVRAFARYVVSAVTDEQVAAWTVQVEMVANYSKSSDATFSEESTSAFAMAIGIMTIHPYAREAVQSLVSRMGYPPFTMDLIHPITGLPDYEEVELDGGA